MDRVLFPKGKQKQFLLQLLKDQSGAALAKTLRVYPRSLSDWVRERYSLPLPVFKQILKRYNIPKPSDVKIKQAYWHTTEAGRIGAVARLKKYGRVTLDEEKRAQKWREWWNSKGKHLHNKYFKTRPIRTPFKTEKLAEFVGIMIGDGGMTDRQTIITLNYKDDSEYIDFVSSLIHSLFGTVPSKIHRAEKSVDNLIVSRTELVRFCLSIGLKKGNKIRGGLDIPLWIKEKKCYTVACIRGIMDTDGCIYNECHMIKGKRYCYPRIAIVSMSPQLRHSLLQSLQALGFSAKIRNNRCVSIERKEDIARYFQYIGSSNPKHIRRYREFGGVG